RPPRNRERAKEHSLAGICTGGEQSFGAKAPQRKSFFHRAIRRSATGSLALVHPDRTARKAGRIEISDLADTLTDQDGRKPIFARLATFDPAFHGRANAAWKGFFQNAALQ